MQRLDERAAVIAGWMTKADNDLTTALQTLKLGKKAPTDTICFHAQQCIEKSLKAALVYLGIHFPRTHDLSVLSALLPKEYKGWMSPKEQEQMTDYAVTSRYPGDYLPITLKQTRQAVSVARRVRKTICRLIPCDIF
ncbi:MAG: hypothetical protein A2268_04425 [Candidatus Raymondbacteria bacterium RifOxyA12_full_50_37]|uniref:HEPN domain-containing protein n=1 Tax=Candidatus Raymondbacteria bacterium RIFOXYD12_FULL_49_13 TaxID=1817890 RepID=A0A1F7FB25_UNCRA|nr:MAG: hypothetical protein A2268_04425 [Candidatus Raymondbacteria bacterium RifOxyA12_full_50_37]OGJ87711.1 MAG: hypothetical protein A2350_13670 [Candidatus Raymondbacteria bacterium RifOxyB12_full_50_8]OGJ92534.1 MAG: hypothetical protein A2248_05525 [Candidatus Raymondbacteria bacterium RIFOXYA2_FULL_49_16]OGJ97888.1 MAG: hypothetical protein A2453_02550 [Candidatus Raymondbacteria bacterium RIFOXYC2_FULL_50_21]OGK03833.1 MAG: hypothetical protein A2519_02265 [Candidatus Raymondbacteria b